MSASGHEEELPQSLDEKLQHRPETDGKARAWFKRHLQHQAHAIDVKWAPVNGRRTPVEVAVCRMDTIFVWRFVMYDQDDFLMELKETR